MIGTVVRVIGKRLDPDCACREDAFRGKIQIPGLQLVFAILLQVMLAQGMAIAAATNEGDEFKLRPPRGEIAPSFWEQNGKWIAAVTVAGALLLALLIWYFMRPKPAIPVPPEVRARKELEALAGRAVDRELLSSVSQALKRYLAEVFGLPREELTTGEFCKLLTAKTEPGQELAKNVCEFLRRGDQMKFAPGAVSSNPVPDALRLLDQAETRRAELRLAQANANANATSATAALEVEKS